MEIVTERQEAIHELSQLLVSKIGKKSLKLSNANSELLQKTRDVTGGHG
jgi:hypothetical protein